MKRKILAILLSVCVVVAFMPAMSFAGVQELEIKGIDAPVAGAEMPELEDLSKTEITPSQYALGIVAIKWMDEYGEPVTEDRFQPGKAYCVQLILENILQEPLTFIDIKNPPSIKFGDLTFEGGGDSMDFAMNKRMCIITLHFEPTDDTGLIAVYEPYGPKQSKLTYTMEDGEGGYYYVKSFKGFSPVKYSWYRGSETTPVWVTESSDINEFNLGLKRGTATYRCIAEDKDGKTAELSIPIRYMENLAYSADVTVKDCTYNGKSGRCPSITIKYKGKTLKKGTDYSITYAKSSKNRKGVGTYKFYIDGKGDFFWSEESDGPTYETFRINPKGTTILTPVRAKKAFTAKWKKQSTKMSSSRISGYQVQYATNSKFTTGKKTVKVKGYSKTSKKFTGLKAKKKYYVHVRTYKVVNGKTYYSPWSGTKTVTTK